MSSCGEKAGLGDIYLYPVTLDYVLVQGIKAQLGLLVAGTHHTATVSHTPTPPPTHPYPGFSLTDPKC